MHSSLTGRPALAVFLMVCVAGLVACDRASEGVMDSVQVMPAPPANQSAIVAEKDLSAFSARTTAVSGSVAGRPRFVPTSASRQAAGGNAAPVASPSLIIRSGDVSIQVDSIEPAIQAVRALTATLGGYVGNVAMNTGAREVHSATLELKIPAARFDEAMAGVRPLGKVEHSNATAQDVGEEYVDINARISNGKRLEARLVALLAARTGKLEDVLAVERELARVREEIERSEGRIRYLSSRIAMSTITVTVHEKAPLVASQPGTNVLGRAFVNMWRNFVHFVATGIEALGVAVPVFALAALTWVGWKRVRRRQAAQSMG